MTAAILPTDLLVSLARELQLKSAGQRGQEPLDTEAATKQRNSGHYSVCVNSDLWSLITSYNILY
jgi:hypothetical protein